jgi:hypothetical protein
MNTAAYTTDQSASDARLAGALPYNQPIRWLEVDPPLVPAILIPRVADDRASRGDVAGLDRSSVSRI